MVAPPRLGPLATEYGGGGGTGWGGGGGAMRPVTPLEVAYRHQHQQQQHRTRTAAATSFQRPSALVPGDSAASSARHNRSPPASPPPGLTRVGTHSSHDGSSPHHHQKKVVAVDTDGSGIGARSCLGGLHLPHLLSLPGTGSSSSAAGSSFSGRRRRLLLWGGGKRSEVTSQTSSVESSTQLQHVSLIDHGYYYNSWESMRTAAPYHHHQQQQQPGNNNNYSGNALSPTAASSAGAVPAVVSPTTSPPTSAPAPSPSVHHHLLTPPVAQDRSAGRRRGEYERSQRRRSGGVYEGEVEPEGVRGQEATAPPRTQPVTSPAPPAVHGRSPAFFQIVEPAGGGGGRLRRRRVEVVSPNSDVAGGASPRYRSVTGTPDSTGSGDGGDEGYALPPQYQTVRGMNGGSVTPDASAAQQQSSSQSASSSPSSLPSESEQQQPMQFSVRTGRAARRPIGRFPPAPPPPYDRSEESSCGSDDDLRKMMPDLLPADRAVPNLLHSMSAAQQDSDEEVEAAAEIPMRTMRQRTETPVQHQRAVPPPERPRKPGAASASPEEETETPEIDALNAKAMGYVHAGEYDHALAAFSRVLRLQLDRHGPVHPSTASAHHNLGTVHAKRAGVCPADSLQQRHCRARAMECFQAAARSARDSLGRNHPNVAVSLVRIGFLLLQSRQYHNAIVTFTEALRIRVAHYGEQHGLVANLYNNLGVCNMHLGEFEAGRKHLESAETIQRHVVASTNNEPVHLLELADTLFNIGGLCLEWIRRQGPDTRRSVRAEQAFQEALQIRTRVLGAQDPMVLQVKGLLDMARSVPRPRVRSPKQQQQQRPKSPALQHRQLPTMKEEGTREGVMEPPQVRRSVKSHEFRSPTPPIAEKASPQASSIFREKKSSSQRKRKEVQEPPVPQITVSSEGGEEKKGDEFPERKRNKGTRIFITPHFVPEMSPQRPARRPLNSSDDAVASGDNNDMSFSPDTSSEAAGAVLNQSYTYDAEESCLISDSGVDSEHGRIHYPLTWNKAGIQSNESESVTGHDIIVTRPFRAAPLTQNVGRGGGGLHGSTSTNSSKQRGSETVNFSTGNKERDDVMARARAILQAHSEQESETGEGDPPSDEGEIDDEAYDDPTTKSSAFEQDLQEDGVAPLGGHWVSKGENGRKFTRDMLKDPMNFLPEIHDEASRQLKKGNLVDAQYLFEMVLRCQRRRHGTLHPDVAAALHNVGIAQLREQNHLEALKAFEEAARVRKGSLGKDHPLVAVSLVKVGISLLLLQRFEDALWSFREALSVRKHALGALHPSTARIYNNIGCVYVEFNEFREARRAFEAALDTQRNALCHDPDSGPLMFGTATTLCNLGYLYRYRDMHDKAASVLKEALDLQECVLGRSHPTVLSTLDNLADSCVNSGHAVDALKYYNMLLDRFRVGGRGDNEKLLRAEAVLLYKMSRVHRQRNDREAQLDSLKLALRALRSEKGKNKSQDTLERRIQYDIRECRELLEKEQLKWV